jgi:hypothetical protein
VKAIETWSYTLAVQAATFAAPLVAMYNLRSTVGSHDAVDGEGRVRTHA